MRSVVVLDLFAFFACICFDSMKDPYVKNWQNLDYQKNNNSQKFPIVVVLPHLSCLLNYEEHQLRQLIEAGKSVDEICSLMVKTRDTLLSTIYNLGLKIQRKEEEDKRPHTTIVVFFFQITCRVTERRRDAKEACRRLERFWNLRNPS